MFAELFDPIIKDRHNGYDPRTMKHPTDLDASKVPFVNKFSILNWAFSTDTITRGHHTVALQRMYTLQKHILFRGYCHYYVLMLIGKFKS